MSKLGIDPKSVLLLFSDNDANFLIPDYQRPYAWGEKECQTLWDDLFQFAFPDSDCDKFRSGIDKYFLGSIVTFKNERAQLEIIDGQQRLTTLMLLLRAFYVKYENMSMNNDRIRNTSNSIARCIWKTDEFGSPDKNTLRIDSEVATDRDKEEFLEILRSGEAQNHQKSSYANNYRFFQAKINAFLSSYFEWFSYFPVRIMNSCILLPIEAEDQDTALQIFSTLNDRGKPLSDADIFKAQFYRFYNEQGKKDEFIQRWKDLETLCNAIFHPIYGTPMDEIFTRYMYYERAKQGIKSSTTEALRKFYERGKYALLKRKETFENLIDLANFWNDVENQSVDRFSDQTLRLLYVLNYAPNSMWTYFVSVYYMANRNGNGMLDDDRFCAFLNKITAFIWAYAITNPGVNALRTPIFAEMVNIVNGQPVNFSEYLFDAQQVQVAFQNYTFNNNRAITRSMLTWWAYQDADQKLLPLERVIEIEHIFARNRQVQEPSLSNGRNLESLGNKAILEKRINIRASDYRFADKKKYYLGFSNSRGQWKAGTDVRELVKLAETCTDFTESDIVQRHAKIIQGFIDFLHSNDLLCSNLNTF